MLPAHISKSSFQEHPLNSLAIQSQEPTWVPDWSSSGSNDPETNEKKV